MKILRTIFYLFFPLMVGFLSSILSGDINAFYDTLTKPTFAPPGFIFGIVWPILYILMGIAYYLIKKKNSFKEKDASFWYYTQLFFNFFWSIIFFRFESLWFSFVWLLLLFISIIVTFIKFKEVNKTSAYLLIPYILWVIFAGYLNLSFAILN